MEENIFNSNEIINWFNFIFDENKPTPLVGEFNTQEENFIREIEVTFKYFQDYYMSCLKRLRESNEKDLGIVRDKEEKSLNGIEDQESALKKLFSAKIFSIEDLDDIEKISSIFDYSDEKNSNEPGIFNQFMRHLSLSILLPEDEELRPEEYDVAKIGTKVVFGLLKDYYEMEKKEITLEEYLNLNILPALKDSMEVYKDNPSLKDTCQRVLNNLSDQTASVITASTLLFLEKHNRFCNLRAKYNHTARMCYLTERHSKEFQPRLRALLFESVMYHDLGRFYQAIFYPSFAEKDLKNGEENIGIVDDHAKAGYYYSLQTLISKDLLHSHDDMDIQFVMHSLMGVAISYHQSPNNPVLSQYDVEYSDVDLSDESFKNLSAFLKRSYELSELISVSPKNDISSLNKDVAEEMATNVMNAICAIKNSEGIEDENLKNTIEELVNYVKSVYPDDKTYEKVLEDPQLILNDDSYLEKLFMSFGDDRKEIIRIIKDKYDLNKEGLSERFENLEERVANRDVAKFLHDYFRVEYLIENKDYSGLKKILESNSFLSLDNEEISSFVDKLKNSEDLENIDLLSEFRHVSSEIFGDTYSEDISKCCRQLLGASVTVTTDMDKLDIFVQRGNGSWQLTNNCVYSGNLEEDLASSKPVKTRALIDGKFNGYEEKYSLSEGIKNMKKLFYDGEEYKLPNPSFNHPFTTMSSLWWHCDQFMTMNMRNYSSFETIKDIGLLGQVYRETLDLQKENNKQVISPIIKEPLAFAEMFTEIALNSRIVNGKLILPSINEEENGYSCVPFEGDKPSIFTTKQMKELRKATVDMFKKTWKLDDDYTPQKTIEFVQQENKKLAKENTTNERNCSR